MDQFHSRPVTSRKFLARTTGAAAAAASWLALERAPAFAQK